MLETARALLVKELAVVQVRDEEIVEGELEALFAEA
jgi:hypothetical protein